MAEAPPPYAPPPPQTNPYHAGYDQPGDSNKYGQRAYPAPPPAPGPYPAPPPAPGPYPAQGGYPMTQQPAVSTTQVNVTQVSASPVIVGVARRDYTCSAIWVCLLCFWPTGIAAIYFANRAQDEYGVGNFAEAEVYQRRARMFIILSIVLGIVALVIGSVIAGVIANHHNYYDPYV